MIDFRQMPRWLLWSLFLPLIVLNGWAALKLFEYFQSFFTIVIAATLFAFILSYPVTWLQRFCLSRTGAIAESLGGFVVHRPMRATVNQSLSSYHEIYYARGLVNTNENRYILEAGQQIV